MRDVEDTCIRVTNANGLTLELTLPSDAQIMGEMGEVNDRWLGAFRTILFWQGFAEKTIDDFLPTEEVIEVKGG